MTDRDRLAQAAELAGCPNREQNDHVWARGAARRVLSARPPDYEAAMKMAFRMWNDDTGRTGWTTEQVIHAAVDAALGGPDRLILSGPSPDGAEET